MPMQHATPTPTLAGAHVRPPASRHNSKSRSNINRDATSQMSKERISSGKARANH